ncbi:MAG: GspMb/PilO family protein [Chthoniobacteraceae bacterium]|jgi:hypothetical protein
MTLSSRERTLAVAMGAVVFILLNLVLLSAFSRRNTALRVELAERQNDWTEMRQLLGEQTLWSARDAALTAKQPVLDNESAAGVELLETVRSIAKKNGVTTDNESIGGVNRGQWYRSVPISLDAHSTWPALISFFYTLQKPDQFIVCEDANVQVDPGDQTKMLAHLKIARWYAP